MKVERGYGKEKRSKGGGGGQWREMEWNMLLFDMKAESGLSEGGKRQPRRGKSGREGNSETRKT